MKKRLWLIAAVLMCAVMAMAVSAETDGYYTYEVTDGEATITEVDTAISGDVVIPDTLGGYPVTAIGEEAFNNCIELTTVIIPDSVIIIDYCAFVCCENLSTVTISKNVTTIDMSAFLGCSKLTEITVSEENTSYASADGVLFSKDMTTLYLYPTGKNDTTYTIPNGIIVLSDDAFYYVQKLTEVSIPASVELIGSSSFRGCSNLTAINVSENNAVYTSVDGVLFSKDMTVLVTYPIGKNNQTYSVPKGVVTIGELSFTECQTLTNVILPDSVTYIADYAFLFCFNLTNINLPEGLITIGISAFNECKNLENISFPESLENIVSFAFYGCTKLSSVIIPGNGTSIYQYAFQHCTNLEKIVILGTDATIYYGAFRDCPNLTIYGYTGSTAETYANKNSIPFVDLNSLPVTRDITLALTTYGDAADVTIQLLAGDEVIRTETVPNTTGTASFTITGVAPGSYTIRVSKPNHVSRSCSVTVQ